MHAIVRTMSRPELRSRLAVVSTLEINFSSGEAIWRTTALVASSFVMFIFNVVAFGER